MFLRILPSLLIALLTALPALASSNMLTPEQLGRFFKDYDKGCFVMLNANTGETVRYNEARCAERLSPCSTFKIFNSMAGLETGVLANENHPMTWDGVEYQIESWNYDQTLQTAVSNSCVWYFQKVAEGVGEERMKTFLTAAKYGNQDISGGLTKFWLGSSLKISANEQIEILKGLLNESLPFSKRSMAITRGLIRLQQTDNGVLYGKTGSHEVKDVSALGWFVGYFVQPGQIYIFATNIEDKDSASGKRAKELCTRILEQMNLL